MEILLALLASLIIDMEAAEANIGKGKDAKENKGFVAELNKITAEIKSTQVKIDELEADEKAQEEALASVKALKAARKPQTVQAGGVVDPVIVVGKDNVIKDPKLGFQNLGDCARAVYNASQGQFDPRLAVISNSNPELEAAGLRQGNGPEGGFLVPPEFSSAMLEAGTMQSLDLYKDTTSFNLDKAESITLPAINESSRKDGSRWGGTRAFWAEEEATMTESQPKFREITLRPKELHIFTKASNKLLKNSPIALGQLLSMIATDEIAFVKSDAIINGDGVGKPKGIMKSNALVTVAKKSAQAADTVVLENTTKMLARLTLRWRAGAVWLINKDVLGQLQEMVVGNHAVFMPQGGVSGLPFSTLHGLPIIETEYNEVLGDKGDIILTNLKAYVTAQNGVVQSDSSIHFNFDVNKTAFRWVVSADGQTWAVNKITDFKGSGTTSPYVTLAERT